MSDPSAGPRRCVRCDEALPADRSVCPSCGTLQPAAPDVVRARPRTVGPIPVEPGVEPGLGDLPGLPVSGRERAGPLQVPPRAQPGASAGPPEPAGGPAAPGSSTAPPEGSVEPWPETGARRRIPTVVAVLAVLAFAVIAVVAVLGRGDDPEPPTAAEDPVGAVRSFCSSPRPLGDAVPAFDPAQAAIAYVEHPQPSSATEPDDELVLQVAPALGEPVLELAASVELVNVAVCVDEQSTADAAGRCRFELTNQDDLGREVERPLQRTTYEATIYELRSGDALGSGPLATATDRCPEFAFTDGDGVSTALSDEELVAWLAANLPVTA